MARTKQEIENQLKDFYKRLRQRMKDADVFDGSFSGSSFSSKVKSTKRPTY